MTRSALLLSATLFTTRLVALAQALVSGPASTLISPASAPPTQLDLIEHKLDGVLQRVNQPRVPLPGASQDQGGTSGAPHPYDRD